MNQRVISMIFAVLLTFTVFAPVQISAAEKENNEHDVELTNEQKEELYELYKKKFELKKEMIQKHVEFGIISPEKGEEIIDKLDKMQEEIDNGTFKPKWGHKKCHHKDE